MIQVFLYLLISTVLIGMVPRAMPIFASAIGENIDQSSGVLNLGVEGIMLMGAIIGLEVDFFTHDLILAFLAAGAIGVLFSLFHAIATITFRADQVVSGTAIWFIGWGISGVIFAATFRGVSPTVPVLGTIYIPYLTNLPLVGKLIFGEDPMAYILVALLIAGQYFLYHTKQGLNLRTVGNDPRVAEIMGVNPFLYRYAAVLFGGFMAGLGGAYLTLVIVGSFYFDMTAGMGFIAVALVYFGKWNPWRVFAGSLIFGAVYIFYIYLETIIVSVPYEFFDMWPYLAVLGMILVIGLRARPPTSLALPYIKEE